MTVIKQQLLAHRKTLHFNILILVFTLLKSLLDFHVFLRVI